MIHRIEIFDNSHISGNFAVSACVVFDDGKPNKDEYRRFRLSTGGDDVASMEEVIYRRYFRLMREKKRMPDLSIVDGGKTQLNAARDVIADLELSIPVVSLVKDDYHRTRGLLIDEEVPISVSDDLYTLLVSMQDEVHRFVIAYHRQLRSKSMTRSILEEVDGLGEVGRKKLYNRFGSIKRMREASLEELSEVIPMGVAENLKMVLGIDWKSVDEKINKLGIFDSGLGGYSVFKALKTEFSDLDLVLFADQKNAPYGNYSSEKIIELSSNAMRWFLSQGIEDVLLACNTVTSVALDILKVRFPSMRIWGIVDLTVSQVGEGYKSSDGWDKCWLKRMHIVMHWEETWLK